MVDKERETITFYRPTQMPEKDIEPKFKYLKKKQI